MRPTRALLPLALLFLLCLALTLHYSPGRLLWSDEILATVLVTDPSLHHMLQAWRAGADGGGPAFYLLARLWTHLFGTSALALRLFSSAGVAIGCAALVRLLTPFVRLPLALFVTLFVCFSSDVLLWQLMQFRFYGLLFALTALATLLAVQPLPPAHPRRFALAVFVVHTLLTSTHPFGLVYSAALLAAMVFSGRRDSSLPYRAPPALLGWWTLLLTLPALRASAAITHPHFWTTTPHLSNLLDALTVYSLPVGIILGLCSTVILLALLCLRPSPRLVPLVPGFARLGTALLALFTVLVMVWLLSQRGTSLFVDRYLIPTVLAATILLALELRLVLDLLQRFVAAPLLRTLRPLAAAALLLWVAVIAVVGYPSYAAYPSRAQAPLLRALDRTLPRDIPIVTEPPDLFMELAFYRIDPRLHPVFLLDWPLAIAPDAQRGETSAFHEVQHWQQLGYFPGSVRESDAFLATATRFAVLDVPSLHWLEHRLAANPEWQVTPLPDPIPTSPDLHLWFVTRRAGPAVFGATTAPTR